MTGRPHLENINTPPSLQAMAFQAIKKAIMTGEFQPGQIYSEQALAGDMGISKTPVHQALLDLANKGFVTIIPRRGFQVNTLMERNIRNLFQFRQPLELTVVRFAAPTLTPAALNDLEGILARMSGVRDPYEFQKFDRAFHRYLASLTENELIIQALENVWDLSDWVGARVLAKADRYEETVKEHIAILDQLRSGDAEAAAAAMDAHLKSTETLFCNGYSSL